MHYRLAAPSAALIAGGCQSPLPPPPPTTPYVLTELETKAVQEGVRRSVRTSRKLRASATKDVRRKAESN
jgi:hypothetical protein